MNAMIYPGDCLTLMPAMEPASVDAIVTDPPYGLGFMGKDWDHGVPGEAFWVEAWRVAKPGAHLVGFGGTRTFHRLACAIEDAGWEIRDCLSWLYGSGFPKSHNLTGRWQGWGTALKPGWEPIILARKPLAGTVAENVAAHGTGALNVDGCRIATAPGDYDHPGNDLPNTRRGREDWRMPDRQAKPNPRGRWPANVCLDEDGAAMLDEQTGELASGTAVGGMNRRSNKDANCYGHYAGERTEGDVCYGDTGGASRFFYCAKASRAEREEGLDGMPARRNDFQRATSGLSQGKNPLTGERSGVTMGPRTNHHPTVKPVALMRWLCRLVTPPGGLILDPFMGSGTTGIAAAMEGFRFAGMEREAEYLAIAERRITAARQQPDLWSVA